MTIISASSRIITRESSSRLNTSYGDITGDLRPHVIVELQDDTGHAGFGEASPLPFFTGETVEGIDVQLREHFLPELIGRSAHDVHAIFAALDRLPGNTSAKAAIDIALHDLQGKLLNLPTVDLLGGRMRECVDVTYPIGIRPTEEAATEAEQAVERGIGTLKLKIGRDPDADVERVQAVRAAVGSSIRIRIDANAGYTVPAILRVLDRLASVDIEYVEQPVASWDFAGMAAVRQGSGIPVMADESLHSVRDAVKLIEHQAADIFAIKLIKTGGLHYARVISQIAAAHNIDIVVISPFDTQIGAAAGLALALAAPTGWRAHELRVFDAQPGYAVTDIRAERGKIYPSDAPGLGVESIRELDTAVAGAVLAVND